MNLTNVASLFKKSVVYIGGIVIFYYVLILVIIPFAGTTLRAIFPEKDPPTIAYGILPPLEFIEKPISGTQRYELNTPTGNLPNKLPTKMKVYKFKPVGFSYNAGKSAQNDAAYLGFTDADLITDLKGKTYRWRSLKTGGVLEIQIDTKKVSMNTNLLGKTYSYKAGALTDIMALTMANDMLESLTRTGESYTNGDTTISKGKYVGNKLVQTEDRLDAQIYRIDYFRNIEDTKILGPDPKKGLLHVYLGIDASQDTRKIDALQPGNFPMLDLNYAEIETDSKATYPLISVAQAWEAISTGNGIVANVTPKGANPFTDYVAVPVQDILVNDIYLAYYETPNAQKYLQPIYVFEGNYKTTGTQGGDITIYFPAVAGEYVQSVEETQE